MERDLLVMIYGALMGVVGSIITSIVTAVFQLWLERRESERKRSEERHRQLNQIYLPSDEDVLLINSESYEDRPTEAARTAAEAGSVLLSILLSSALVYNTRDPNLGFAFSALLAFYLTRRILKTLRR